MSVHRSIPDLAPKGAEDRFMTQLGHSGDEVDLCLMSGISFSLTNEIYREPVILVTPFTDFGIILGSAAKCTRRAAQLEALPSTPL